MKRIIQYEIETDKTGEFCLPTCPWLTQMSGKCRITNRHIKFRPDDSGLLPVRNVVCKEHERAVE